MIKYDQDGSVLNPENPTKKVLSEQECKDLGLPPFFYNKYEHTYEVSSSIETYS